MHDWTKPAAITLRHRKAKTPQILATDGRAADGWAKVRRVVTGAVLSMPAAYVPDALPNIVESTERFAL
jgi:hypothetical protein